MPKLIQNLKVMQMDETSIVEVWDTFKDYIHEKSKESAASQYVNMLVDKGVETSTLKSLVGYDSYLDDAIHLAISYDDDDDYSYDDDDYDYDEDDED